MGLKGFKESFVTEEHVEVESKGDGKSEKRACEGSQHCRDAYDVKMIRAPASSGTDPLVRTN